MTMNVEDFLRNKKLWESLQRSRDRAQGKLDGLLQRLQKEFGCSSLSAAKKLLSKKTKAVEALEEKYQTLLTDFRKTYQERLAS